MASSIDHIRQQFTIAGKEVLMLTFQDDDDEERFEIRITTLFDEEVEDSVLYLYLQNLRPTRRTSEFKAKLQQFTQAITDIFDSNNRDTAHLYECTYQIRNICDVMRKTDYHIEADLPPYEKGLNTSLDLFSFDQKHCLLDMNTSVIKSAEDFENTIKSLEGSLPESIDLKKINLKAALDLEKIIQECLALSDPSRYVTA